MTLSYRLWILSEPEDLFDLVVLRVKPDCRNGAKSVGLESRKHSHREEETVQCPHRREGGWCGLLPSGLVDSTIICLFLWVCTLRPVCHKAYMAGGGQISFYRVGSRSSGLTASIFTICFTSPALF